jgi:transcriptional regulator with XRE-family HTH domain
MATLPLAVTKHGVASRKRPRDDAFVRKHIGARLRELRVAAGLSQRILADLLHVTCQQLQKYEAGANRITAARLYYMAHVLEADVGAFFEDLPMPQRQVPTPEQRLFLDLARNFAAIRDEKHREAICLLTKILASLA